MLREDQEGMRRAPAIGIVAPLTECEAVARHARDLATSGWAVHLLVPDWETPRSGFTELRASGVEIVHLSQWRFPTSLILDGPNIFPLLTWSDQIRYALTGLHRSHGLGSHGLTRIEFTDGIGLGFRTVQARRMGLDFAGVPVAVWLREPSQLVRKKQQQWPTQPEDLAADFCERFTVEHADIQIVEDATFLDEIHQMWPGLSLNGVAGAESSKPRMASGEASGPGLRKASAPATPKALVTVCVPFYNLAPFLEEALASLAAQTYPALEVLVIDDGSTDADAIRVFDDMRLRFPRFQFLRQANAGIGATRNRALELARGEYFLPMDADNVATPEMIERFVVGLERNRDVAALTSYFLAFTDTADLAAERYLYAYKPTAGPHVLGALRNVYGDGNALFRTRILRGISGFTTDRDASFEDWEVFVKLVNAGHKVEVLPDFLFYYRHREAGFSRVTSDYRNHQRILRQYCECDRIPQAEREALWRFLFGQHQRVTQLEDDKRHLEAQLHSLRHRLTERVHTALTHIPGVKPTAKWLKRLYSRGSMTRSAEAGHEA
ncbi:MAG: glycosyltransferase family 2 protein [Planctomycetes bacterium]|nr:glycosyltransferase family 2 protein [Planctomycetota bacterium]